MGYGFHYFHLPTAKYYLDNTMAFLSKYPFLDTNNPYAALGEYYIMRNSLIDPEEIKRRYISLNDYYRTNYQGDTLIIEELQSQSDDVHFAFKSKEGLLDFAAFKQDVLRRLSNSRLTMQQRALAKFEGFDLYINCTWEKMEELSILNGIDYVPYTNRRKMLAKVHLDVQIPCRFFCAGQFAMITNCGDHYKVTYAPITNLTEEPSMDLARQLIKGATKYIPELANSRLVGFDTGYVKSIGSVDITDRSSDFHKRNYSGLFRSGNVINNAAMKLSYAYNNAKTIASLLI